MKTVEFRDGERDVPDHVAVMLQGIETHTKTYQQAIRASEQKLLTDRLNQAQASLVADHLQRRR